MSPLLSDSFFSPRRYLTCSLLSGLVLWLLGGLAFGAGVNLAWNPPTMGPIPAGYTIHYGTSSGSYDASIKVGNVTAYSVTDLTAGGEYFFALKSYDASGNSSADYSNEVAAIIPLAGASRLVNISTRGRVGTGDDVMIGGLIIGGTEPKKVFIRALGPDLANAGVTGVLSNPAIRLTRLDGTPVAGNDNWKTNSNAGEIQSLGYAPSYDAEAALLVTLQPNMPYTPIVEGVGSTSGVALIEVYEVDGSTSSPRLINLSTRMRVGTGDNVLIGGFVIGGAAPKKVLIRALGPDLANAGVTGVLSNPAIRLTRLDGTPVAGNDNWETNSNAGEIRSLGYAPSYDAESALLVTLPPGAYTPIVNGVGGTTGVALVEIVEVE